MSDYTPEEQEFIGAWVSSHSKEGWGGPVDIEGRPRERMAEARRGIAKVKADALREAAKDMRAQVERATEHQRFTEHELIEHGIEHVLNEYADRIEREA